VEESYRDIKHYILISLLFRAVGRHLSMEYEASKILEISLAKIDRKNTSRKQTTGNSTLRRNLLVSSVLKAIKPDAVPGKDILMDYRETKIIDLDVDEANFERDTGCVKSYMSKNFCSDDSVDVEWKPRGCSDLELKGHSNGALNSTCEGIEGNSEDIIMSGHDSPYKENSVFSERFNNTSLVLRNSITLKRPRDSDFGMSHMPRPHKICRVVNNESCEVDTQSVSCLETLFRDSFNEFREQASYDRPFNIAMFPLVSVMAC